MTQRGAEGLQGKNGDPGDAGVFLPRGFLGLDRLAIIDEKSNAANSPAVTLVRVAPLSNS